MIIKVGNGPLKSPLTLVCIVRRKTVNSSTIGMRSGVLSGLPGDLAIFEPVAFAPFCLIFAATGVVLRLCDTVTLRVNSFSFTVHVELTAACNAR